MTRYQVDARALDERQAQALFRRLLRWAAAAGDRFEIRIEQDMYDDAAQRKRLRALGEAGPSAPPRDALSRALSRTFDSDYLSIRGVPDEAFVDELTRAGAPDRVVVGSESPVETVVVESATRPLYVAYDYGSAQVLELSDEEKAALDRQLTEWGYAPTVLVPIRSHPS